jgi:hypothetical protein
MVPIANIRKCADKLKELNMIYEYGEMPGVTHGPIIEQALPSVYAFFASIQNRGPIDASGRNSQWKYLTSIERLKRPAARI